MRFSQILIHYYLHLGTLRTRFGTAFDTFLEYRNRSRGQKKIQDQRNGVCPKRSYSKVIRKDPSNSYFSRNLVSFWIIKEDLSNSSVFLQTRFGDLSNSPLFLQTLSGEFEQLITFFPNSIWGFEQLITFLANSIWGI